MVAFYKSLGKRKTEISRIGRISFKMLGPESAPVLRCKAAECRHLLPLLADLLDENRALFGLKYRLYKRCAVSINVFYDVIKGEPRQMSGAGLRKMQSAMLDFVNSWKAASGHLVFKHHMAVHLCRLAETLGNPRYYHTYADEEENRCMGRVAKQLHGSKSFYATFLQRVKPEAC